MPDPLCPVCAAFRYSRGNPPYHRNGYRWTLASNVPPGISTTLFCDCHESRQQGSGVRFAPCPTALISLSSPDGCSSPIAAHAPACLPLSYPAKTVRRGIFSLNFLRTPGDRRSALPWHLPLSIPAVRPPDSPAHHSNQTDLHHEPAEFPDGLPN